MSWYDDRPVYYDKPPGPVKLPHDPLLKDPDKLAKLSGPVVTYKMTEREEVKRCRQKDV